MATEEPKSLPKPIPANAALLSFHHLSNEDPGLVVTPEKATLPKNVYSKHEQSDTHRELPTGILTQSQTLTAQLKPALQPEKVDLIPTKLSALANDPTLDVTPEKTSLIQKKGYSSKGVLDGTNTADKNTRNLHVRFDVPELPQDSEESLGKDILPLDEAQENPGPPRQEKVHQEPFKKRAALYVQRNPLAEITCDSSLQETSENTTGSETLVSTDSDNSSGSFFNKISQFIEENGPKVADMSGKVIRGDSGITPQLPEVKLKTVKKASMKPAFKQSSTKIKSKIINVVSEENRPPPRSAIDEVTRPQSKTKSMEATRKKSFLKKKSGLHRHEHSIRYDPETAVDANPLSGPTYNSTLSLGQELQELKVTEFNAKDAVKKKMEGSERLRNYVAEKTAEATNIDPEEKLYQNLVSVDVEEEELVTANSTKWKRTKPKPFKPKKSKYPEPDIWETYDPKELYYSDPMIDYESLEPPAPAFEPAPMKQVMWADQYEQLWNGAWGWEL